MTKTFIKGNYTLSTDKTKLDLDAIHHYLTRSYWSTGIPKEVIAGAIEGSLCFGLYHEQEQVGFARVITDTSTFAYLADVYILKPHRGQGLSRWMMEVIMNYPSLQGLRRWMLATKDAHGLYKKFGFTPLEKVELFMEISVPNIYLQE
ncbi:GNAT family N-acetyltransferase [Fulvivirgaceae bacterium BMA10]|uniref:GNAT family N-acetyltransferase n=1 Tax=Splendidivirga corallicola TaxID=3051826 RepID=A0ABT8KLS0_9BACT|nr:GNAT family N-acetyltransferase [Fulvivirgaceae bacterium BMA10]